MYVTHEELNAVLEERFMQSRADTKSMIDTALAVAGEHEERLVSELRASMRDVQREASLAAAGYELIKEQLRDSMSDLASKQEVRFDELKTMITRHDAPIARLRMYETIAAGGVNLAAPALTTVKKIASILLAGIAGGSMGLILFGLIAK